MDTEIKMESKELKELKKKIAIRFPLLPFVMVIFILLPAGSFDFWQVYAYVGVLALPMTLVILYFIKKDPKFLERRMKMKEKEKQQKRVVLISSIAFIVGFLIPGLDHRYEWSNVPLAIVIAADVLVLLGYIIVFYVFKENSYASRIVEVSEDQKVISTGPYRFIRHPMYLGILILYLSTPIALGSFWAIIPFAILPFTLILRIMNEEKVLSEKLQGYKEYCQKTKYRLIPYIW